MSLLLRHAVLSAIAVSIGAPPILAQGVLKGNVELYIGATAGGENDRVGRILQKALTDGNRIGVTMSVVNKPGAGQELAVSQVRAHPGDPHFVAIASTGWLATQVALGNKNPLDGLTPLARLMENYQCFYVQTESPIKDMADVKARLSKSGPGAVSFAYATAAGSPGHVAIAAIGKASGVNPNQMKMAVFDGSTKVVTQVAGGHVDVGTSSIATVMPLLEAGRIRMIGIGSPERLPGRMANVPTLREQGVDVVSSIAFMIVAPAGLTPEQRAYWEHVLNEAVHSEEVGAAKQINYWGGEFLTAKALETWFKSEYAFYREGLAAVGLISKQ